MKRLLLLFLAALAPITGAQTVISSSATSAQLTAEANTRAAADTANANALTAHTTDTANPHGVTKAQVGLANVDNTSDEDKPVSDATATALALKTDQSDFVDETAGRESRVIDPVLDFGVTPGTGLTELQRSANVVALQAAVDSGGSTGAEIVFSGGPFEINGEILIRNHGVRIRGVAWNYENTNTSRIIQTAADKAVFKLAIPSGFNSIHHVGLDNLYLEGPGVGTSTAAAIDFALEGPTGSVFSDFLSVSRVTIKGFFRGMDIAKNANSIYTHVATRYTYDGFRVGGNCNNLQFVGCHVFEIETDGRAWRFRGSAQVTLRGGEYGVGGALVGFDAGTTGVSIYLDRFAVEQQEVSTVVTGSNSLFARGGKFLAGAYPNTVPFVFEQTSIGVLDSIGMGDFTAGLPLARGTYTSMPTRLGSDFGSIAPNPVEIHPDNTFAGAQIKYGVTNGKVMADNGGITASQEFRGMLRHTMIRDALGSQPPETVAVCVKAFNGWSWEPITNADLRKVSGSGSNLTMAVNTNYRATSASLIQFLLPATANAEDEIMVIASGAGGVEITQNAAQSIRYGSSVSTAGTGGKMVLAQGVVVRLKYNGSSQWFVISAVGTPTVQ